MKTKEDQELLDTMVEASLQDVAYQFNLTDEQAIKVFRNSLERLEKENL